MAELPHISFVQAATNADLDRGVPWREPLSSEGDRRQLSGSPPLKLAAREDAPLARAGISQFGRERP